jgi:enoyl-CoA hydratase/carnithine racemase
MHSTELEVPMEVLEGYETIRVEIDEDKVATITLDRPEVMNSFNQRMRSEFARLWPALQAHPEVHAVVLRAAGERAFSTGLDVREHGADEGSAWVVEDHPWDELEDPGPALGPKRNSVWKPVIAAVNGMCAGGAFYWVAEADIVLASETATFFDPHVSYGMVAALEPILLSYRMRSSDVLRMALMGLHERMSAESARESGLVSEVVPAAELDARAHQIAATIASQPTAAVQGTVKAVWLAMGQPRATSLATGLLYTQVGNPLGVAGLDRSAVKPRNWELR